MQINGFLVLEIEMTKQIQLTQGKVSLVDDDMFEYLNQWKWCAAKNQGRWYAIRSEGTKPFQRTIRMHRVVINPGPDTDVDHKDGNGLNNQRYNLRECIHIKNSANRSKNINNISGYKGVYWNEKAKKWHAQIMVSYKRIHLGLFQNPGDAARAYDEAAKKYFGEFARFNFPG